MIRAAGGAVEVSQEDRVVTEFEGERQMLAGSLDGKPMPDSAVEQVRRLTRGNVVTVQAGPEVIVHVQFTADPSQSPAAIDYVHLSGANAGKSQLAIYELRGDILTVCVAAPGAARPSDFTPGPQRTITKWKRAGA